MRTLLLGAASVAALSAAGSADAQTAGYVDVSAGQLSIQSEDFTTISVGGAAAVDVAPKWRAQFDANFNRFSLHGNSVALTNGAAHVYYQGSGWAAGGVASTRGFGFATMYALGVEAQKHFGPVVLEGGVGTGTLEGFGQSIGTTTANGDATFYATDNFSVGLSVDYLDASDAFGKVTSYGIDSEYKFAGSTNSVFASYERSSYDLLSEDADTWRIGVRHSFGDDTLQGRRNTGPRWLPVKNDVAIFGFGPSDRRLKRDIALLATLENGMKIYSFRYLWSDAIFVGVMAQDLLVHRDWRGAVVRAANGYYAVNYAALGLRMTTLEGWRKGGHAAIVSSSRPAEAYQLAG